MTRTIRTLAATLVFLTLALPAWAIVIRGIPGSVHTVATLQVDPDDIGRTCEVRAIVVNGDSTHIGNELRIEATAFQDVEGTANSTETFETSLVLDATITAQVRLNDTPELPPIPAYPEGRSIWSADVTLEYECDTTTTTSTTPNGSSSTTSSTTSTTVTTSTTTPTDSTTSTTTPATTSTTSVVTTSTTVPPPPVLVSVDCVDDVIVVSNLVPGLYTLSQGGELVDHFLWNEGDGDPLIFDHDGSPYVDLYGPRPGIFQRVTVDCDFPVTTTSTVPPVTGSTLPFTGAPVETAGVAMAAAALLVLGGGVLMAAREK